MLFMTEKPRSLLLMRLAVLLPIFLVCTLGWASKNKAKPTRWTKQEILFIPFQDLLEHSNWKSDSKGMWPKDINCGGLAISDSGAIGLLLRKGNQDDVLIIGQPNSTNFTYISTRYYPNEYILAGEHFYLFSSMDAIWINKYDDNGLEISSEWIQHQIIPAAIDQLPMILTSEGVMTIYPKQTGEFSSIRELDFSTSSTARDIAPFRMTSFTDETISVYDYNYAPKVHHGDLPKSRVMKYVKERGLGSESCLGSDNDGMEYYILASGKELIPKAIIVVSSTWDYVRTIVLPPGIQNIHRHPWRLFDLDENGNIYYAQVLEDGVHVLKYAKSQRRK